ncbi:hypothetical protein ACQYI3_004365 [Enterobacter ludwigii]
MEFTEIERELLSWFIGKHWVEFAEEAEEIAGINALHRLAEKLGIEQK